MADCPRCAGTGKVQVMGLTIWTISTRQCPTCGGSGHEPPDMTEQQRAAAEAERRAGASPQP